MLKYNHIEKSGRTPFIIYANLESLLEKMNACLNNPKKPSSTKINKGTSSGDSLFIHCSFERTKNKLDYYTDKSRMKNFCLDLREHAIKIIYYEKEEMIHKLIKEINYIKSKTLLYMQKKDLVLIIMTIKNIIKLEIIIIIVEI